MIVKNYSGIFHGLLKPQKEREVILISYCDRELTKKLKGLKKHLNENGCLAVETYDGILQKFVYSGAGLEIWSVFDHTKYATVIVLDAIKTLIQIKGYFSIAQSLNNYIGSIKTSKDVLFIHDIERKQNFPLHVCFVVNKRMVPDERLRSINDIVDTIKSIVRNINAYDDKEIMNLSYDYNENRWDIENAKFSSGPRGKTVALTAQRTSKLFGHATTADVPETPYNNYWEYINNVTITEKAMKNALKIRTSYYQRLWSLEDIKQSIILTGAAQISFYIYESFFHAPGGKVPLPVDGEACAGGHSVCLTGYTENEFIFINSFGRSWGNNGIGYLPFEYLKNRLIEAWGSSLLFNYKKITSYIWRPAKWKLLFKESAKLFLSEHQKEKIILKGAFTDKRRLSIKYEVKVVMPLSRDKGYFYVINLFDPKVLERYGGWCHFSLNPKKDEVIIDDLFVSDAQRKYGWAKFMLENVEILARRNSIKKMYGWVSLHDVSNELALNYTKMFFSRLNYACIDDTVSYIGSAFKVEKELV